MPANHASRILVEPLEQRRLLAAAISANEDLLVFNDRVGGGYSPTQGVIITNTGSDPLIIPVGGIRLRGAHPQNFLVTYHPALGATIAPGESVQVRAAFKASGLGIRHAQLQIESNDPDAPLTAISLRGLGTKGLFGNDEPPLQWVLDVHDIPVDVGDPDLSTPIIDQPQETGEQMAVPFLRKAGPGPVSIEMLGLFSSAANPAGRFGYYTTGGGPLNELFVVHGDDVQSVNPRTIGTTSFDPGEATFGLFSTWPNEPGRVVFSHDERNTWAHPGDRQKYRFYPMRNRDGSIELNALVEESRRRQTATTRTRCSSFAT